MKLNNIKNIIILALVLKIILFILFCYSPVLFGDDITRNYNSAVHLIVTHSFHLPDCLDQQRTPGYSIFIGLIYLIKYNNYLAIFVQLLFSIGSIYFTYLIGKKLYSEKAGLIAAFISALLPDYLIQENILNTETIFVFLLLLSFYFLISDKIIYSFIILAIGCYFRPILMYIPIIYTIYLLINKCSIIKISTGLVLFYGIISIWCLRNYIEYGYFRMSSLSGLTIYSNSVMNYSPSNKYSVIQSNKEFKRLGIKRVNVNYLVGFKESDLLIKESMNYFKAHKLYFIKEMSHNFKCLHFDNSIWILNNAIFKNDSGTNYISKKHSLSYLFSYSILWLYNILILIGIYYAVLFSIKVNNYLIIFMILYFILLTTISANWAGDRHRMPILPFYILLASSYFEKYNKNSIKLV